MSLQQHQLRFFILLESIAYGRRINGSKFFHCKLTMTHIYCWSVLRKTGQEMLVWLCLLSKNKFSRFFVSSVGLAFESNYIKSYLQHMAGVFIQAGRCFSCERRVRP
jgi:hypothetical protein